MFKWRIHRTRYRHMTLEPHGEFHGIQWVVRRTINRKTGVVMAEDCTEELTEITLNRPFKGHTPKEVLTVFFYWDPERTDHMVNYIACSLDLEMYLSITSELLNLLFNDPHLLPRSSYRKAIGEGVRTFTYGAHTSLAALQKSHKLVTNITTADNHQRVLLLCHKLATLMPRSIPYLCITVVVLTTGEDLAPHRGHTKIINISVMRLSHSESGKVVSFKPMKMIYGSTTTLVINGLSWTPETPFTG